MVTEGTLADKIKRRWSFQASGKVDSFDSDPVTDGHHPSSSGRNLPSLPQIKLCGYSPTTEQHLLSVYLANEIRNLIPPRLQLYDEWHLVYSLEQHGVSLHTLYHRACFAASDGRSSSYSVPASSRQKGFVLVVTDTAGDTFGAFLNEPPRPSADGRYHGNGQCFLWKCQFIPRSNTKNTSSSGTLTPQSPDVRFKAYVYTGVNDYMIYCTPDFLSVGGGDGRYGLWLDSDLESGVSSTSLTFGNESLSDSGEKFRINGVELWMIG